MSTILTSGKWADRFLDMAVLVSGWSKDPSTKVGAVIVDEHKRVVGIGYNGFPRTVKDHPERYDDRPTKYEMVVHAEINAILNANKDVRGCTLYSTFFPCPRCAAAIVQSGIKHVVSLKNEADERYAEMFKISKTIFNEAEVWIYLLNQKTYG